MPDEGVEALRDLCNSLKFAAFLTGMAGTNLLPHAMSSEDNQSVIMAALRTATANVGDL